MALFIKKSSNQSIERNQQIACINLEKVVSVLIIKNEEKYSSRFFAGKKRDSINCKITVGIKDMFALNEFDFITIIKV